MNDDARAARPHRLFVYGTLQRGAENHAQLAQQDYLGPARTAPGYRLYRLEGYPGLVADPASPQTVRGEVWAVDAAGLARLDAFEGVGEGLYERVLVRLEPPYEREEIQAYLYLRSVTGCEDLGERWAPSPADQRS